MVKENNAVEQISNMPNNRNITLTVSKISAILSNATDLLIEEPVRMDFAIGVGFESVMLERNALQTGLVPQQTKL